MQQGYPCAYLAFLQEDSLLRAYLGLRYDVLDNYVLKTDISTTIEYVHGYVCASGKCRMTYIRASDK